VARRDDDGTDSAQSGGLWLDDDLTFEDLDPVRTWRTELERAERAGQTDLAESLRKAGPPLGFGVSPRVLAPVVLSVEVGGDPGGAIGVALAALRTKRLALVIVVGGAEPARYTRYLLNLMRRPDVTVVASSAPSTQDLYVSGLTPSDVPIQATDVARAVRAASAATPYLVLWGNSGPLTDLAAALSADPALADRLGASVAAGPFDSATPQFASDPGSAAFALSVLRKPSVESHDPRAAVRPSFPPELLTADPGQLAISPASPLYRRLTAAESPAWARLLGQHLEQWFDHGQPESVQYAALTVASVEHVPLISTTERSVVVDGTGRIQISPNGTVVDTTLGLRDHFIAFTDWLDDRFREAIQNQTSQ
jgi:pyrimidine-specific ribonucleoside hydrolase